MIRPCWVIFREYFSLPLPWGGAFQVGGVVMLGGVGGGFGGGQFSAARAGGRGLMLFHASSTQCICAFVGD
jgi:hypothetical protein